MEIPVEMLSPKKYETVISIDVTEPGGKAILTTPDRQILNSICSTIALPHVLVSLQGPFGVAKNKGKDGKPREIPVIGSLQRSGDRKICLSLAAFRATVTGMSITWAGRFPPLKASTRHRPVQ